MSEKIILGPKRKNSNTWFKRRGKPNRFSLSVWPVSTAQVYGIKVAIVLKLSTFLIEFIHEMGGQIPSFHFSVHILFEYSLEHEFFVFSVQDYPVKAKRESGLLLQLLEREWERQWKWK